jgi:hypothetical protein
VTIITLVTIWKGFRTEIATGNEQVGAVTLGCLPNNHFVVAWSVTGRVFFQIFRRDCTATSPMIAHLILFWFLLLTKFSTSNSGKRAPQILTFDSPFSLLWKWRWAQATGHYQECGVNIQSFSFLGNAITDDAEILKYNQDIERYVAAASGSNSIEFASVYPMILMVLA